MFPLISLLYRLCLTLIDSYKWMELQVLKLFNPFVSRMVKFVAFNEIGVIYHCPADEPWTEEKEEEAKAKNRKFDRLLHVKVNDDVVFPRVACQGTLAVGESYMEKMWEVMGGGQEDMVEVARRSVQSSLLNRLARHPLNRFLEWVRLYAFNLQTEGRASQVAEVHYNLGNDLFELMLDPHLQYTCGYWARASTLEEAQVHKMDLIARKLDLRPGMRVLDLGCGWGTLCKYLAENYQVECVGVTISKEGAKYGRRICEGLPVKILQQDYRQLPPEKFDRVASIGLMEHVGVKNYRGFFDLVIEHLKDDGIFLLHTIGRNHQNVPRYEPWVHKYIFPNGNLPQPSDITECTLGKFIIEDWHNFGLDYGKTLKCWRENFNKGWPEIAERYGERFYRMWTFCLTSGEGLFLARRTQLWQIVLSKDGLKREYRAAR